MAMKTPNSDEVKASVDSVLESLLTSLRELNREVCRSDKMHERY